MACPSCEGGKQNEPLCDECKSYLTEDDKVEDNAEELAIKE